MTRSTGPAGSRPGCAGRLMLGVETSCDETSAAVVRDGREVLSNVVSSQVDIHRRFGGVVPEVASRNHAACIVQVVDQALREAGLHRRSDGTVGAELAGVAVTCGPGLVGALLVGLSFSKGMAYALGKPLLAVNHIQAHVYANALAYPELEPPFVCLTVSGGHTDLVMVDGWMSMRLLGKTRDDAAGEAFDKVARLLELPYPGGPEVDRLAASGNAEVVRLPRADLGDATYDTSFSGLKTAVARLLSRHSSLRREDVAAAFQSAVADSLLEPAFRALNDLGVDLLVLAGGVAANSEVRRRALARAAECGRRVLVPPPWLCTDNAAMVAGLGFEYLSAGRVADLSHNAFPSMELTS